MDSPALELTNQGSFDAAADADILVVLLHAYRKSPKSLQRVADAVRAEYPRSDILAPSMPLSILSLADVNTVAADVVIQMDKRHTSKHKSIVLIGHSMGAIIARKVWLLAHGMGTKPGENRDTTQELEPKNPKDWAGKIHRIVLLAALNRGWMINSALGPMTRLLWTAGTVWGNFCRHVIFREPVIFAFRRGAAFLTLTRLQCLALDRRLAPEARPVVVQLLGTADNYVAPSDNVDLATGGAFHYVEVPRASHGDIVELNDKQASDGELTARKAFGIAFVGSAAALKQVSLSLGDVFDLNENDDDEYDTGTVPQENLAVTDVVFVIHGIRDRGFWTHRIARAVKTYAREVTPARECRTVTSTYGYFAMGPFLLPWVRRAKAEWLLDQVVRARSLYPNATFSYIGHSNGTYLLATALQLCPVLKVPRVIFAGSVVRTNYGWQELITRGQVEKVLNYIATHDWVVAIFPNGLQWMGHDIGGAGHNGFTQQGSVRDVRHIAGAHGAALSPHLWPEMAHFIIDSNGPFPNAPVPQVQQACWVKAVGRLAPLICIALAGFLVAGFVLILRQFDAHGLIWLAGLLAYGVAVWALLTKF